MKRGHRLGRKRWWGRINAPLATAAAATLLCAGVYAGHRAGWWQVPALQRFELTTIDARFKLRGERKPKDDDIVILAVDDRTRAEAPEVFQTRRGWAKLLSAASKYEPLALGLDLFYAAPEVAISPEVIRKVRAAFEALKAPADQPQTPDVKLAFEALDAVLEETRGDQALAAAIEQSQRIFLGVFFGQPETPGERQPRALPEPEGLELARFGEAVAVAQPPSRRPFNASYVIRTLPSIGKGAVGAGAINVVEDADGEVRRVNAVLEYGGRYYMHMGLAMALAKLGHGAYASYVTGDNKILIGDTAVPVTRRGEAILSQLGPRQTFPYVSAADVLSGKAPKSALEGKLVFVGFADAARDKIETPFDSQIDGVEIHATLAYNILHGELMREAPAGTTLATILILGALLTLAQIRRVRQRRAWVAAVAALVLAVGYLIAADVVFAYRSYILEVAAPLMSVVFVALATLSVSLFTEGREKAQYRAAFSQYVNDTLAERIANDWSVATLGGERRELTVLFSDIRGFSRFSEKLEPEVLSDYLNEYLTPMTRLVMDEDGMLDKYIGDAVMAVYGAPIDMTDHAARACRTAMAMLMALEPLNERWRKLGLPEIAIGVGVNSGAMSVGNMGSDAKFDYTVMGDAVNLGARLEGLTKEYKVDVLVGQRTAEMASEHFLFRELDLVRVVGRESTARIYELVGPRGQVDVTDDDIATYEQALDSYRAREWDRAEAGFRAYAEAHPGDGPSQVMLSRIENLREHPPGDDWDGVFAQVSK